MKKTVICLLVCLLCFSMLVACGGDPEATTASTQTTATTATTGGDSSQTDPARVLELVKDYETDYRIVVSKNATDHEWDAAYNIRMIILTMTGVSPAIVEDDTAPQEKEIVVGANTNRSALYTVPVDYDNGYCVFISGNRLIVEARSSRGMQLAVQNLGRDCFGVNIAFSDFYKGEELSELTVSASYQRSDVFEVSHFVLVHDDSVYTKRMSYIWMSLLDGLSGTRFFVESEMTAEMPAESTGAVVIKFVGDDKIADGEWKLHDLGNNSYEIHAADYYGFTAAGRYFKSYVGRNRETERPYPTSAMGSYLDEGSLSKAEESNAYAFTHTGDIRVMFNNILFHEPSIEQRNYFSSLLFSAYMPDVIGLQEVNIDRRGDVEEANGGVIALMAEYGYVETIDPRVQNAYPKTELIPGTDAVGGRPIRRLAHRQNEIGENQIAPIAPKPSG